MIKIGREEDGYSIMGIHPIKTDTTVNFAMDESEMVFEVAKLEVAKRTTERKIALSSAKILKILFIKVGSLPHLAARPYQ